jgi:hypothetical protein
MLPRCEACNISNLDFISIRLKAVILICNRGIFFSRWSGSTSQHGGHSHTYSGNTENLGSGAALAVTNAYIMLMGWYRIS